jgi:hypothetical protein
MENMTLHNLLEEQVIYSLTQERLRNNDTQPINYPRFGTAMTAIEAAMQHRPVQQIPTSRASRRLREDSQQESLLTIVREAIDIARDGLGDDEF